MQKGCYAFQFLFKIGQNRYMRSRKRFRADWDKYNEGAYSPLLGESDSEGERTNPNIPRGAPQIEGHVAFTISH